jgi:hypothetical protein
VIYAYHPRPGNPPVTDVMTCGFYPGEPLPGPPRRLSRGVHPKWVSCFPGGAYFGDDGTPDPDDSFVVVGPTFYSDLREKSYQDVLAELGF